MDFQALLIMLAGQYPILGSVLAGLGILVVVGQAVVVITPGKKDDEALAKLKSIPVLGAFITAITAFAPIQKK